MATQIKKIRDLVYDELVTLSIIENDEDLNEIFSDEVSMSFNLLKTLSKEDKLPPDTKALIRNLFDKVILTKTNLINRYVLLAESKEPEVIEKKIAEPEKADEDAGGLPRRYGKANIEADIKKQGGKATNAQLTALEVNDLKNLYVKLSSRLINDMLGPKPILSDEDYRDIRSVISIMKNKMKPILKKK